MYTDRSSINGLVKQQVNQGVAFEVSSLSPLRLEDPPPVTAEKPFPLLVALDELQDVHNVGAIARSAFLLQADGIVSGVRGAAPLNGTVSKTSSGALEHLAGRGQLYVTQSLPSFLGACRDAGWRVIGAAAPPAHVLRGGGLALPAASPAEEAPGASAVASETDSAPRPAPAQWIVSHDLRRDAPTVLVLGGEAKGLRTNVRRQCTAFTYVAMGGPAPAGDASRGNDSDDGGGIEHAPGLGAVDSLNVAAAAAILLHQLAPRSRDVDA